MKTRQERIKCAEDTLQIINKKLYPKPITALYLQLDLTKNVKSNHIVLSNRFVRENTKVGLFETKIFSIKATSLEAAFDFPVKNNLCILNFASSKHPGGGFLTGALAQEESIARSSNLYSSLLDAMDFYNINTSIESPVYSHNTIYSKNVTVFKNDQGQNILPYVVDVITSPAINRSLTKKINPQITDQIMTDRAKIILSVALSNGVRHLILGAWGCGVFKNDPVFVNKMFKELLDEDFKGAFETVTFAIPDSLMLKYFL